MLSSTPRIPDNSSPSPPTRRPGAKPIHPRKFPKVRAKLHSYRVAVQLEGVAVPPSLHSSFPFASRTSRGTTSTASRTQPRAGSESSYATSRTTLTAVFSARNGSEHHEPEMQPLQPALKARKALIRYLERCDYDCYDRKVKCLLSHHSLEDILDGNHDAEAESDVRWALGFDSDPKGGDIPSWTPVNQRINEDGDGEMVPQEESSPSMKEVIDDATNKLGVPDALHLIYPDVIDDAHLEVSPPDYDEASPHLIPSHLPSDFAPAPPPERPFNTHSTSITLALATLNRTGPYRYYQCQLPMGTCACFFYSPEDLLAHVQRAQAGLVPLLPDPLRLVCLNCIAVYAVPVGVCSSCDAMPARLLVNICWEISLEMANGFAAGPASYEYYDWGYY